MNTTRQLRTTPAYITLIAANALPVYGAFMGKIVFFQLIYLYWLESLLLIGFDVVRIACARGRSVPNEALVRFNGDVERWDATDDLSFSGKLRLITQTMFIRVGLLLFYLIFIIAFIAFQVTDKAHRPAVYDTMALRGPFASTAVWAFVISNMVQLLSGFFFNGQYRRMSPRAYLDIFPARILLLHFMIVIIAMMHSFVFKDTVYAARGEMVYISLFMLFKTMMDIRHIAKQHDDTDEPAVSMI